MPSEALARGATTSGATVHTRFADIDTAARQVRVDLVPFEGLGLLLFLLVGLVVLLVWLWTLVAILETPQRRWEAADQQQAVWVIVVAVLPLIGLFLYFWLLRPKFQQL